MKAATLFLIFNRLLVTAGILALLSALSSCSGKSNHEDDTFRQSVIDDPVRAQEQNEAAKVGKSDLFRKKDTTLKDTAEARQ